MKKLIAFIISTFLIQLVPSAVMAAEETVAFNESFEGYVTGAFPSAFKSSGSINACVAEGDKNDKELLIVKRAGNAGKLIAAFDELRGNYVVSFKVKAEGGAFSGSVKLFGTAIESPVAFENNAILTGAGKRYGTLKNGEWTRFDVVLGETEERRSRYDLYIDGVKVLEQWKFETANFKNMTEIQFCTRQTAEDVNFYIDDIYIYSGDEILPDSAFPKKEYNKRSVEFVETDFSMGDTVFIKEDFENGIEASSLSFMGDGSRENFYDDDRKSNTLRVNDQSFGKYNLFHVNNGLKTPSKVVYQMDVCQRSDTGHTQFCMFKYLSDTKFAYTANLYGSGELTLHDKTQVATLKRNRWYTLSFAYDYMNQNFDVYVDGRLMREDHPFSANDFDIPTTTRIVYWTLTDKLDILVDNVCMYEGDKPRDIFKETENEDNPLIEVASTFTESSVSENLLTGTLAFHVTSGAVWKDDQKTYPEVTAYAENDVFYLPLRTVCEAFGKQIGWDSENACVTADGVKLKNGMTTAVIGNKSIELTAPVTIKDGVTYIPSDIIGKDRLFGINAVRSDAGLCILDAPEYSKEELVELNRYMVNERPTSQKVKEDYLASGKAGVHPRIFADAARFEELKKLVKEDGPHKLWYEKLSALADKYLDKAVIPNNISTNMGNRTELADRVQVCSLMYRMTGEKKYLDKAYAEMAGCLEWPVWDIGLCAGEISYLLGLGYDWLYDGLSPQQRKHLEEKMSSRSLSYLIDQYESGIGWVTVESNWNHVSNSGVIAAFALADVYPEQCYAVIANCARSMDFGLETYSPDGQWFEGPGYYNYESEHLVSVLMAYTSVLGTDYHMTGFRGVERSGDYVLQINGPAAAYNYSDTIGMSWCDAPGLVYLANVFERPDWVVEKMKLVEEKGFNPYVIDFVSLNPVEGEAKLPNNAYFRSEYGDLAVMRGDSSDSNSVYLAYRAGKAKVSHGQQEAGSFILDMNGVRWAEELGREAYSVPGYNSGGDARWTFYKTRAEGHNTIVVNPDKYLERNLYGVCYAEKSDLQPAGGYTILNLDETYNNRVDGYRRGYMLDDNRRSVVIRDEVDLRGSGEIYWFMQTKADIKANGSRAILTRDGKELCMDVIVEGGSFELLKMAAEPLPTSPNPPQQTKHTQYNKVAIKVKGNGRVNITVKLFDPRDEEYLAPVKSVPLDNWTAPTHELLERPKLDNIFFNGVPAEGFSPNGGNVTFKYDYDGQKPEITTAHSEDIAVEIKETDGENGRTMVDIVAYRKTDRTSFRRYSAEVRFTPYLRNNLNGYTRYETFAPQGAAADFKNLTDGDLITSFATQGIGAEVGTLDMGEIVEIDAVAIGFYDAYKRENPFDISVSNDGVNFEVILSDKSTMLTDGYEIRKIEPVKARYIKYTGYGSSVGDWNNLTEFAALKKN